MKNNSGQSDPPQKASKTRRLFLWLFNPRAWGDWERTKSTAQYFLAMIERFFVLRKKSKKYAETFDGAVAKFDLDEEALKAKALGLKRLSYSLLVMAIVLFSYTVYQLLFGSFRGVIIAGVETGLALVLAFRYHFWSFQIKKRKLGCGFKEWYKDSFKGGNP
ncbi:MAG: type IVB secretion system protein IcmV [Gammaproteobacteria bacterium]|nr:type IVB secretion system protein IcmV [Gammaproteobacteria bacterium]